MRRVREQSILQNKATSEAAHASETRWKLLFEQSPLSVQIFSPDGQTKRVNAAWRNLFRLTEEQGLAFNVLKDPDLNASGAMNLICLAFEGQAINVPPVPYPVNNDPPEHRWIGGAFRTSGSRRRYAMIPCIEHERRTLASAPTAC